MTATRRNYGPAIAMGAGIILALVLAALAPFNMVGPWNDGSDATPATEQMAP